MKEITCDICKIKIGSKLERDTLTLYGNDPGFYQFMSQKYEDICNNCTEEIRKAIHEVIKKLEKEEDLKWRMKHYIQF